MSRSIIRMAKKEDTRAQVDIYAPFILHSATSFEMEVPTIEDFWQRIEKVQAEAPWLVSEVDGVIAGYAYAGPHRSRRAYQWSREVSAYVHPDFHRRGIGRALYNAVLDLIGRQGYRNAYAGIVLPNAASVAFHESMGFEPIGVYRGVGFKFGSWHDVGWWSLKLGGETVEPREILAIEEFITSISISPTKRP